MRDNKLEKLIADILYKYIKFYKKDGEPRVIDIGNIKDEITKFINDNYISKEEVEKLFSEMQKSRWRVFDGELEFLDFDYNKLLSKLKGGGKLPPPLPIKEQKYCSLSHKCNCDLCLERNNKLT